MAHTRKAPAGTIVAVTDAGQTVEIHVVREYEGIWKGHAYHECLVAIEWQLADGTHVVPQSDGRFDILSQSGVISATVVEVAPPLVLLPDSCLFFDAEFAHGIPREFGAGSEFDSDRCDGDAIGLPLVHPTCSARAKRTH